MYRRFSKSSRFWWSVVQIEAETEKKSFVAGSQVQLGVWEAATLVKVWSYGACFSQVLMKNSVKTGAHGPAIVRESCQKDIVTMYQVYLRIKFPFNVGINTKKEYPNPGWPPRPRHPSQAPWWWRSSSQKSHQRPSRSSKLLPGKVWIELFLILRPRTSTRSRYDRWQKQRKVLFWYFLAGA